MRSRMNIVNLIFFVYILLDIYSYFGLKSVIGKKYLRLFQAIYLASSVFFYYSFYRVFQMLEGGAIFRDTSANIYLGLFLTAFVGKLFFCGLMLLQDSGRLLFGTGRWAKNNLSKEASDSARSFLPTRRKFLTMGAAGIAAIPFFTMLYGITKGKYRYTLKNELLSFKNLPSAFNGFKIVQISDIHAGSFDSPEEVARGVALVNAQNPDLILFTGDLVNSDKNEIDPYISIFEKLRAKHGKFAILGNHDYYGTPDDEEEEKVYWADFYTKYQAMGFDLMNNTSAQISLGDDWIQLLGVENWGASRYFPKRGDLDQALQGVAEDDFCILLSHDPTHWSNKVLDHPRHIPLTLSGHTHGFQFGINVPGFKWSPAQYRYEHWMGLYEEKDQLLYVNRGFGFLGFPGRVGMWPEITVLELQKG